MKKFCVLTASILVSAFSFNPDPLLAQTANASAAADQQLQNENAALRKEVAELRERLRLLDGKKKTAAPQNPVMSAPSKAEQAYAAYLPTKAAPYTASPNWTGYYVGGTAGVGWGTENSDVVNSPSGFIVFPPIIPGSYEKRMLGFIGGIEGGYNQQFNSMVLGIEADFSYAHIDGSTAANETFFPGAGTLCPVLTICTTRVSYSEQQTLDWLASLRARVGFAATPSWLIYGTGGWAFGEVKSSAMVDVAAQQTQVGVTQTFPTIFSASSSKVKNGWIVGGGTEYMLTQHWSGKVEYLYYDLGSVGMIGTAADPRLAALTTPFNSQVRGQIFRTGVNYKF